MVRPAPETTRVRASRLGAMSGFDVDAARAALEARHPTWVPRSLHATLEDVAGEHAARPFVIAVDGELSYADLDAWSRRIARGLVAAGVAPGDRVALLLPNSAAFVAAVVRDQPRRRDRGAAPLPAARARARVRPARQRRHAPPHRRGVPRRADRREPRRPGPGLAPRRRRPVDPEPAQRRAVRRRVAGDAAGRDDARGRSSATRTRRSTPSSTRAREPSRRTIPRPSSTRRARPGRRRASS